MTARAHTYLRTIALTGAVALIALAWLVPNYSRAQVDTEPLPDAAPPIGTVNCFDYYTFGSVQVNVTPDVVGAVSGIPINFAGTISNDNPYPIVDGAIFIKIFRIAKDPSEQNVNGRDVVDQFFVREGIALPPHSSFPIAFTWDIPSYAMTGEYQLATFFTTSKKFNLLGLSFTDDIVGNTANFSVIGERDDGVWFDKNGTAVGGEQYHFAAFTPEVDATAAIPVIATIQNTTGREAQVPVSWKLYNWDAGRLENLISESQDTATVPAGGATAVTYTVRDTQYPVYFLVGTLQWGNTQSVINIRMARDGVERTRLNFPSLMTFPLQSGVANTLFSCLHNVGLNSVPNGRLELKLLDESGKTIHEYVYSGEVTSAMMGVADAFTPNRSYNIVNLDARLYQGDALVDEAYLTYDCNEIDPATCRADGNGGFFDAFGSGNNLFTIIGLLLAALVVLAVGGWIVRGSRSHEERSTIPGMPQFPEKLDQQQSQRQ